MLCCCNVTKVSKNVNYRSKLFIVYYIVIKKKIISVCIYYYYYIFFSNHLYVL